jgi:hypothetical protein
MTHWLSRIAVLVLPFVLAACVVHTYGTSTKDWLDDVKRSTAFRVSDAFYPGDVRRSAEQLIASATDAEMSNLLVEVRAAQRFVVSTYRAGRSDASKYFSRAFPQSLSIDASIKRLDKPIARTQATQKGGTIQIDIRVLHSLFRASLAATGDGSEDEQTDEFLKRKARLRTSKGRSLLGDIFDDDADRISQIGELVFELKGIDATYSGAILFMIAHESGHVALGHLAAIPQTCAGRQAVEGEADRFAAFLITRSSFPRLLATQAQTGVIDLESALVLQGASTFFDYGYSRIGFGEDSCSYLPPNERLQRAKMAAEEVAQMFVVAPLKQAAFERKRRIFSRAVVKAFAAERGLDEDYAIDLMLSLRSRFMLQDGLSERDATKLIEKMYK